MDDADATVTALIATISSLLDTIGTNRADFCAAVRAFPELGIAIESVCGEISQAVAMFSEDGGN